MHYTFKLITAETYGTCVDSFANIQQIKVGKQFKHEEHGTPSNVLNRYSTCVCKHSPSRRHKTLPDPHLYTKSMCFQSCAENMSR